MRAIHITTLDGPEAIEVVDLPDPSDEGMVTIAVKAAGVAFPELLQTRGLYQVKPDLPFVPGAEVAGVVEKAPDGSGFSVGDRVAALCLLGGFAEKVQARPDLTFVLPDEVTFEEGASFLFNYATVYFALVERGGMAPGESVLVHGAAGGIGTAAIQVAKAFGADRVVAVVSTEAKGEVARAAGADEVVLADGFRESVGKTIDIVVDPVGGDRFTDSLRTLREHGRLLVIGFTAGQIPEVKVNRLLLNNISVVGVGWGAYAMPRPGHVGSEWEAMLPHLRSGALRPVVGASYPLEDAVAALTSLEGRTVTGKVVLQP
ncbi:NADPH:quinone oxidoreductase family protein [Janibacter sp. YIM B02568]|uniref:NADPH:quinone oxidoreductase family protein n=1 Tax=Janibacter endophyticus TaxID=2806261 RepID=UPI001951004B|nr:NADPH:quinone oxidoreductase family protein [Janibacter endophyticus]MBM6545518.1 NADPH:quinone oxidoreductase family protein [Janibacter endophyticus]